jgi:hypothetical protein
MFSFVEAFQNNTGIQVYVGNVDDDFHGNVEVRTDAGKVFVFSGYGGITSDCRSIAQYPALSSGIEYKTISDVDVTQAFDRIRILLQQAQQGTGAINIGKMPRKRASKRSTFGPYTKK